MKLVHSGKRKGFVQSTVRRFIAPPIQKIRSFSVQTHAFMFRIFAMEKLTLLFAAFRRRNFCPRKVLLTSLFHDPAHSAMPQVRHSWKNEATGLHSQSKRYERNRSNRRRKKSLTWKRSQGLFMKRMAFLTGGREGGH